MTKNWTNKDIKQLKSYRKRGFKVKDIARRLFTTENSVHMKIRRLSRKGEIKVKKFIYDNNHSFNKIRRELLIKGLLIWLCEGTRISPSNHAVEVVNSDPRIIFLYMRFLRKLKVNEEKIRLKLKIPKNQEKRAKRYWCKLTNLKLSSFNKTLVPTGTRKSRYPHGTLNVKYNSKQLLKEFDDKALEIIFNLD